MSLTVFAQGVGLGLSMIIPIGAQNSYLLNQGIKRNHYIFAATICLICDVVLTTIGVYGGSLLLSSNEILMRAIGWSGVVFLTAYACLSLKRFWLGNYTEMSQIDSVNGRKKVLLATLSVTLLNPHVYLDTVVILGGVGNSFLGIDKVIFVSGAIIAATIWFYSLVIGASKFSTWLADVRVNRGIDLFVAIVMLIIAFKLFDTQLR